MQAELKYKFTQDEVENMIALTIFNLEYLATPVKQAEKT